jgi:transposase, IS5 family
MIKSTFQEAYTQAWIKQNIKNPTHDLVILRQVIPWQRIIDRLIRFYDAEKGRFGGSLRIMIAILIVAKLRQLSDRQVVAQVKENRYIQYFCNVSDENLQTFLNSSTICTFRKRIQEKGVAIIEAEVFDYLRRCGLIQGDTSLIDSTVLNNNIIYPNDVQLIFKAFGKMASFAKAHHLELWWDHKEVKKHWCAFGLNKKQDRAAYLLQFHLLFVPALELFWHKVKALDATEQQKQKAQQLADLLLLLQMQTKEKLAGQTHIQNRIVSLDEVDARPIKRGKRFPACEFGTTLQMSFNRQGFMVTTENLIGAQNDNVLYPKTLELFRKRMKDDPQTVVTDLGFRSKKNKRLTPACVANLFMGRTEDVSPDQQDFCKSARSATEGFIAVAKNLRSFGCSLYRGLAGDRVWTLLCQTAYNLKKFLQLYRAEDIEEASLMKLGLLG